MSKTILSVIAAAHPKLTMILAGIAITAAILAVPGLQYAHASAAGENKCYGSLESCNAHGVAPGNGGLIPGQQGYGPPRDETPHQCEIGICE
jgi:uncharacterized membrane protein